MGLRWLYGGEFRREDAAKALGALLADAPDAERVDERGEKMPLRSLGWL